VNEYETEPVPGLPERLPAGERMLWQGGPRWQTLARRAFHVRKVAAYFGFLMLWRWASVLSDTGSVAGAAVSALWLVPVALAALGLLTLLAWLSARATLYTITDRRVVLRIGVALPMSVNIPLRIIDAAALKPYADSTGDVTLQLHAEDRVGYVNLWPHVRPWRLTRPEPMLRAIPRAAMVAQTLAAALSAGTPAQRVSGAAAPQAALPQSLAPVGS